MEKELNQITETIHRTIQIFDYKGLTGTTYEMLIEALENAKNISSKMLVSGNEASPSDNKKDGEVACLQISEEVKILLKDKYHEGYNAGYYDGKHDR